jgi:hypothetical protein
MPNDQEMADLILAMNGMAMGMQANLTASNNNAAAAAQASVDAAVAAASAATAQLNTTTNSSTTTASQRTRLAPFMGTTPEQWRIWRRIFEETASMNGWVSGHATIDVVGRRSLIAALHDQAGQWSATLCPLLSLPWIS